MQEYPNFNLFGSIFFIWSSKTETHISRKWRKMCFDKSIHYYLISYMAWNVLRDIEMAYFKWILSCVCIFCRNVFNYKLILLFLCLDTGIFHACVEHFTVSLARKETRNEWNQWISQTYPFQPNFIIFFMIFVYHYFIYRS